MDDDRNGHREERLDVSLLRAAPTLMRLAAGAYVRTAQWGLATTVRVSSRLVRAAAAGESPAELVQDASEDVADRSPGHTLGDLQPAAALVDAGRTCQGQVLARGQGVDPLQGGQAETALAHVVQIRESGAGRIHARAISPNLKSPIRDGVVPAASLKSQNARLPTP